MSDEFSFQGVVWVYQGESPWFFVTLPRAVGAEIRELTCGEKRAFRSVKVTAILGSTRWQSALFPDKKSDSYHLPLKASVRQREQIQAGMTVEVWLLVGAGTGGA